MNNSITENDVKNACIDYLVRIGALVIRVNSGAVGGEYKNTYGQTKKRFLRFAKWFGLGVTPEEGQAGISDILAFILAEPGAIPVIVETKARGNKTTQAQERFMTECTKRGVLVIVAYSVDDVIRAVEKLLAEPAR